MEAVLQEARARGASRVHRIVLRIGTLSGVEPDALRFAFEVVTKDTLAEEAELEVDSVPACAYCSFCEREFEAEGGSVILSCPRCGGLSSDLRRGRELELSQIEMS
jgi:hydrogenase nickel incorporation protein HypA/HybF